MSLVGLRISRPFGTCGLCASDPGVETPGYSRLSLRDSEVGCRIATTIMAEKTRRTLKPHFYFVIISESFVLVPSDMIALGEACGEGPLLTQPGKPCPCLGTVTEYLHLKAD